MKSFSLPHVLTHSLPQTLLFSFSPQAKLTSNQLTLSPFFSHAINTPLTHLVLDLESLLPQLNKRTGLQKEKMLLLQALHETYYLKSLVSVIHRSQPKRPTSFLVKAALDEVVLRFQNPQAQRYIFAQISITDRVKLGGHACLLQEALGCLINNAFEAYPNHQKKQIALIAFQTSKTLTLYLGDQGKGMNWWTQQLLRLPGFTNKKRGHGLGLFFVKHTIETYFHGRFKITSDLNSGTVIMIQIPLV